MDLQKMHTVLPWQNTKDVQSFLGFANIIESLFQALHFVPKSAVTKRSEIYLDKDIVGGGISGIKTTLCITIPFLAS